MLRALTNLAIVYGRLGVMGHDRSLVRKARKRLKRALGLYAAHYEPSNADYLRCRYARACLQERSASLLGSTEEEYLARVRKALAWHQEVLEWRVKTIGGAALETHRSRGHVERCQAILDQKG